MKVFAGKRGQQGSHLVFTVNRLCELSFKWRDVGPLFIAAVDIHKAFDRILHSCISNMYMGTQLSSVWKNVLIRILKLGILKPIIAQKMGQSVTRGRGVCQGRVQSMLEFVFAVA
eukprot:3407973-Karenia_brevis.AAC.1